jgi:hypothetical protein
MNAKYFTHLFATYLTACSAAHIWGTVAAAIHRDKNTVEAAAGLQPQQGQTNKP